MAREMEDAGGQHTRRAAHTDGLQHAPVCEGANHITLTRHVAAPHQFTLVSIDSIILDARHKRSSTARQVLQAGLSHCRQWAYKDGCLRANGTQAWYNIGF